MAGGGFLQMEPMTDMTVSELSSVIPGARPNDSQFPPPPIAKTRVSACGVRS